MKQILRTNVHTGEQLGGPPKKPEEPVSKEAAVESIRNGGLYDPSTIDARLEAGQVLSDGRFTYQLLDYPDV